MDAFAQPDDVTAVSAPLNEDQTAALTGLLAQASTKLRGWARERGIADLDVFVQADPLRIELAKVAVVQAVKRVLGIGDGASEVTVAIDDFRETRRFDKEQIVAGMYIDAGDLVGFLPGKRSGFGMIRMGHAL